MIHYLILISETISKWASLISSRACWERALLWMVPLHLWPYTHAEDQHTLQIRTRPHIFTALHMATSKWKKDAWRPHTESCKLGKNTNLHLFILSIGIPILMQFAASGLSGRGSSSQFGRWSCMSIRGLVRAMLYSWWHKSFSSTSHSSRHNSLGFGVLERSSQSGKTKWQNEGMANCEHWSDRWVDVPIMVNAAGKKTKAFLDRISKF